MAVNEFEKRVQKAMDGFKLHPSGEVWQKVEQTIREKKRKRRIIFFIVFSFIGLALAGYGIYDLSQRQNLGAGAENGEATATTRDRKQNERLPSRMPPVTNVTDRPGNGKDSHADKSFSQKNNDVLVAKEQMDRTIASSRKKNASKKDIDDTVVAPGTVNSDNPKVSFNQLPIFEDTASQKARINPLDKKIAATIFPDTTSQKSEAGGIGEQRIPVQPAKKLSQSLRKIKWGLNISFGSSTITQDRFSFKNTVYADAGAYTPGGPATGGTGFRYPPSPNKPAFAFKAGIIVKKDVSRRSTVSTGLIYSLFADRIKIGASQNSTQQSSSSRLSSYSAAPQKNYTDRFHFIDVPVIYQWRVTKNTNHFFSIHGGFSAARLISTNALTYDTSSLGIYYRDQNLFKRTHVNILSGLSYHVAGGKKIELNIGPQFSFDLSRLIKSDLDRRKYLLYGGVDAQIFFDKKRKK